MSKNFYESMSNTMDNASVTENGMVGYKTTNHELLDFNFKVSSYRGNLGSARDDFKRVLNEKEAYALKFLFYVRDAREGIGERDLFRTCLKVLVDNNTISNKNEIINTIIKETPEYGRWDDLFVLFGTQYEKQVIVAIGDQLKEDIKNYKEKKSISLLAKWMPSENASSKTTKANAKVLREGLGITPRQYRKILSALRKHLDVVEVKTCAKEWDKINYSNVPSKANLKYKDAFLRNDETRRREFLAKLVVGDKSVHINSSVNFPHEIVHSYSSGASWYSRLKDYDEALEQLWKNLKPCVGLEDTIVVRDGSSSMCSSVGNSNVTALDVSTALAIYCSQYTKEAFKNKFITFSSNAKLINLSSCANLHKKLAKCYAEDDCSNTNLQSVFELILKTAVDNNMKQEDLPKQVLVISDMEFDGGDGGYYGMHFDNNVIALMQSKYAFYGYTLPKLAFWNVNSRTGTIPVKQNKNGVTLISGFSQNVLSMVMNGETDPYKALIKELAKDRYVSIPLVEYGAKLSATNKKKVEDISNFLK